ncbi:MAG TPA: TetR/AcrR family transcriptional regulator [Candidatus Dormibacteraeota bacterium]|jgi:AcrR family transcriptional regulator|nr:TetR/AcrR family transcriptional regulator [Candidatus Dormibacteraeota bacterium]
MPAGERKTRERERRRRLILTTAREIAEAEGWEAVTTRRLADAIEYSQPVLYSHFPNRAAIVREVAVEGFAELAAVLRGADSAAEPADLALLAVARAYLEFGRLRPGLYEAMFSLADPSFARTDAPEALRRAFAGLREPVARLQPADADTAAEVVWSSLHGMVTLARGARLRPDRARERLELLVRSLAR